MKCKICGSSSNLFGSAQVLQKHQVSYYRCENCGFIQTETPYWLDEAYSEAITKSDIGLIRRNLEAVDTTRKFILMCLDPKDKFVDYGGGYGIFVRLMRDEGFDFYRYEPKCENLFASGFDAQPGSTFSLLTAWEVFEHLEDPLAEIEKMLAFSGNLFFSTQTLPKSPKPIGQWWYYGLEHGQHISFYSRRTLDIIAHRFNLKLYYSSGLVHFIGKPGLNPLLTRVAFRSRYQWLRPFFEKPRPPSLLESDRVAIMGEDPK